MDNEQEAFDQIKEKVDGEIVQLYKDLCNFIVPPPNDSNSKRVMYCLTRNPDWKWRSAKSICKECNITEKELSEVLRDNACEILLHPIYDTLALRANLLQQYMPTLTTNIISKIFGFDSVTVRII